MTSTITSNNHLSLLDAGLLAPPQERYKIQRNLGVHEEGQAKSYIATDTRLDSPVVMTKRLPKLLNAYNSELALLRASTPHTARLIDTYFESDGSSCIVRSFVSGTSLDRLERGSLGSALKIARQVSWLVHSLHAAKPNAFSPGSIRRCDLILDTDARIWLINCENSVKLEENPSYQISSDIRTVGLLALTMLTGEDFEGSSGDLPAVTEQLPPAVAEVIRRAIDLQGDHRYSSMKWLAQAIESLECEPAQSHPVRPTLSLPPAPKPIFRPVQLKESLVAHALNTLFSPSLTWARLAQRGMLIEQERKREPLCALDTLDIEPYEHQVQAAIQVMSQAGMSAGAILADEVGLGKTIEALIICQELRARGLAESVLIVASPSGTNQWLNEAKTRIRCNAYERGFRLYQSAQDASYPLLIVSSATLKQERHRAQLLGKRYDLVIVDEAHRCCSANGTLSALGSAVNALERKRLLLLSATPLGNRLWDLYTLADLIRPGLLGSPKEFAEEYLNRIDDKVSGSSAYAIRSLRARTQTLVIRHKRKELPDIMTPTLDFTVETHIENSLSSKIDKAADLICERWRSERVVVFAQNVTQRASIAEEVKRRQPDRVVIEYLGNRKNSREFEAQFNYFPEAVIISNDAMSEGMNWQRARRLLQFDVPLTPLVWEQRIGRIYRLGQRSESLEIIHLAYPDSMEAKLLDLYRSGLGLFTLPIGEASAVIDYMHDPSQRNIEAFTKLLLRGSLSSSRVEKMLSDMSAARAAYDLERAEASALDSLYFGDTCDMLKECYE